MVYEGQEKSRCVLDSALLIAKLIFLNHMPELDCCVLFGVRGMAEGDVHHLCIGELSVPVLLTVKG